MTSSLFFHQGRYSRWTLGPWTFLSLSLSPDVLHSQGLVSNRVQEGGVREGGQSECRGGRDVPKGGATRGGITAQTLRLSSAAATMTSGFPCFTSIWIFRPFGRAKTFLPKKRAFSRNGDACICERNYGWNICAGLFGSGDEINDSEIPGPGAHLSFESLLLKYIIVYYRRATVLRKLHRTKTAYFMARVSRFFASEINLICVCHFSSAEIRGYGAHFGTFWCCFSRWKFGSSRIDCEKWGYFWGIFYIKTFFCRNNLLLFTIDFSLAYVWM